MHYTDFASSNSLIKGITYLFKFNFIIFQVQLFSNIWVNVIINTYELPCFTTTFNLNSFHFRNSFFAMGKLNPTKPTLFAMIGVTTTWISVFENIGQ